MMSFLLVVNQLIGGECVLLTHAGFCVVDTVWVSGRYTFTLGEKYRNEGVKLSILLLGNKPRPPAVAFGEATATSLYSQFVDSGIRGDKQEFLVSHCPQ